MLTHHHTTYKGEIKIKKIGKILLWILGIFAWLMFFITMWAGDTNNGTNAHTIILIITGICLAIYIFRKTESGSKELEKENQKLRQELERAQAVQRAMDKAEEREKNINQ